jgi:hypothetical protein
VEGMRTVEDQGRPISSGAPDSDGLTTESVLRSVKAMVKTLDQVVGVLVPLLPTDLNVVTMWQEAGQTRIQKDIERFYETNKDTLKGEDMLVLLSFADQQQTVLADFGINTKAIDTLANNMLKQYKHVVVREMRRWQANICKAETEAEESTVQDGEALEVSAATGLRSRWPEELMNSMWGMMDLTVTELRSAAKIQICVLLLEQLPLFIESMRRFYTEQMVAAGLMTSRTNSNVSPERMTRRASIRAALTGGRSRSTTEQSQNEIQDSLYPHLCASVNNFKRFFHLLQEHGAMILPRIEDIPGAVPVLEERWDATTQMFKAEITWYASCLVKVIEVDFIKEVKESLFSGAWVNDKLLPQNLALTFKSYYDELLDMLYDDAYLRKISLRILASIVLAYVEQALTVGISVGAPGLVVRLCEDVSSLEESFSALEGRGALPHREVVRELRPLKHLCKALTMDTGEMKDFVRDELRTDFGMHAAMVWQTVMAIREEPKEVTEMVYGAIVYPEDGRDIHTFLGQADAPIADISHFRDGLRGGNKKKRIVSMGAPPASGKEGWKKLRAHTAAMGAMAGGQRR